MIFVWIIAGKEGAQGGEISPSGGKEWHRTKKTLR